jgi:hypothetical protein
MFMEWYHTSADYCPFRVEVVEHESFDALPQWVLDRSVPLVHMPSTRSRTGWESFAWKGEDQLKSDWLAANLGKGIPKAAVAAGAGLPPIDQLKKFLPPGTKITIEPPQGVVAKLDDNTALTIKKIGATVSYEGTEMVVTLQDPKPAGSYSIHTPIGTWDIGFLITGGRGPKQVSPTVQEYRIDTTKGPHKIRITMEPAK